MTPRNIRLVIAFDGTSYSGWQRQNNARTIQGAIEDKLARMTGARVILHGAGRTDAGVHACGMVAHFHTRVTIPCEGFMNALNSMLAADIRILSADEMPADFHSRYSATGKTYRYSIYTGPIQLPFERLYCLHYPGSLSAENIKQCISFVVGHIDFSSFEASGSRDQNMNAGRGAVRTIYQAEFREDPGDHLAFSFHFTGDGFLRHMVRNLVGTLLEAGREKISPSEFQAILASRDRRRAGPTAPACGLILERVWYEPLPDGLSGDQEC